MARPTTFDPLVPFDPTPGEVAEVTAAADTLDGAGQRTDGLADALTGFATGLLPGTGWTGSTATGFDQTIALLPAITATLADRLTTAAGTLDSWAADLIAMQTETDRLHADAVDTDAALTACTAELETTTRQLGDAHATLAAMSPDDPGRAAAASAVTTLTTRRHQLWTQHDQLTAHLAGLRARAADLHDQHRATLTATTTAIHDTRPHPAELGSFTLRAVSAAAIHALPHLDLDAGRLDGIISPEELARALLAVHHDQVDPTDRADAMAHLWPILIATATDPAALARLDQTLTPTGWQQIIDTVTADQQPLWLDADGHLVTGTPPPPGHVHASPGDPLFLQAAGFNPTYDPPPVAPLPSASELADVLARIGQGAGVAVIGLGALVLLIGSGGSALVPVIGAASTVGAAAAAGEAVAGVVAGEAGHVTGGAIGVILAGPGAVADDVLRAAVDAGETATVRAIVSGEMVMTGAGLAASILQDDPDEEARAA